MSNKNITHVQISLEPKNNETEDQFKTMLIRNGETKIWSSIDNGGVVKLGLHPMEMDLATRIQKLIREWNGEQ